VQVPFRNRAKTGLVMGVVATVLEADPGLDEAKVRPILDVVDPEPLLTPGGVEFIKFVADYYLSPVGEVVRLAIPSSVRLEGIKCYELAIALEQSHVLGGNLWVESSPEGGARFVAELPITEEAS